MAKDKTIPEKESVAGDQLGNPGGGQENEDSMIHVPVTLLPEGCKQGDTYKVVSMDNDVASLEPVGKGGSESDSGENWTSGMKQDMAGSGMEES